MAKTPSSISFAPLKKALGTLEEALLSAPKNTLERDGVIKRFEYTFELSWKSMRALLQALGRANVSGSPKPLFRDALEEGLIDRFEDWDRFLEARNETVHTYNLITAEEVFSAAKDFPRFARTLLERLEKKAKENTP